MGKIKILLLSGPITLYWHGVSNLKKLGHEVVTHDMIENGSSVEAIEAIIECEDKKPDLVAVDGCLPLRAAAIGRVLTERGIRCLPILLDRDWKRRYKRNKGDGAVTAVYMPVVDLLCDALGGDEDEFLAFDKSGNIRDKSGDTQDLSVVLEKIFRPAVVETDVAEKR
jgi:hypothetical protein